MAKNVLTPEASMSIIGQSLQQTTNQKTGASNYYIIWGFILFIFFTVQFLTFHFKTIMLANLANWTMLAFPLGGFLSFLQSKRDDRKETIIPLHEKSYRYAWIGASMGLGALCVGDLKNLPEMLCLGTLIIFGLINFIIGGVTKFKPLIVGGAISIILTVAVPRLTLDYKFLLAAIGILSSCLIPGLAMKKNDADV
jgi:hypothetical protein